MKIKTLSLIFVFSSVLCLCSFKYDAQDNVNIYLQNKDKSAEIYRKTQEAYLEKSDNEIENAFRDSALTEEARDGLSEIYESFLSALPGDVPRTAQEISGLVGVGEIFSYLLGILTSVESVRTLLLFVAVGVLFSLSELFCAEMAEGAATMRSALAVILSVPIFNLMKDLVFEVSEGISRSSEIFSGIIPALVGILAIGSGGAAASASGAALTASLGFVTGVLSGALLPLCTMIFSISMVSGFDTVGITDGAAKGIRGIFNFLIGLSSLVIVATLGVQTVISVSVDNLATKSAKYALSGMIPVVGGVVSGALGALISGVKLLSSTVGVVSVVAILSVISLPLIKLLFFRFCLFVCITVSSFSGGSFGAKFFGSVRGALDTLIAVYASSSLIYVLEIIIVTGSIRGAM